MFEQNATPTPPSKGALLISEPFLFDQHFKRTVVLLCEHNEQGSFGFVLNRPMEILLPDIIDMNTIQEIPLYMGGPVQNDTLHFIHRDPSLADGSLEVTDGIYWGGNFEEIKERIENNALEIENFRFFIGYSGWGAGQLDAELAAKSWIVSGASMEIIFEKDIEKMWKSILHDMGGSYRFLSNAPESPQMN